MFSIIKDTYTFGCRQNKLRRAGIYQGDAHPFKQKSKNKMVNYINETQWIRWECITVKYVRIASGTNITYCNYCWGNIITCLVAYDRLFASSQHNYAPIRKFPMTAKQPIINEYILYSWKQMPCSITMLFICSNFEEVANNDFGDVTRTAAEIRKKFSD